MFSRWGEGLKQTDDDYCYDFVVLETRVRFFLCQRCLSWLSELNHEPNIKLFTHSKHPTYCRGRISLSLCGTQTALYALMRDTINMT